MLNLQKRQLVVQLLAWQQALPEFHSNLSVFTEWRTARQEDVEDDPEAPAIHLEGVIPLPERQFSTVLLSSLQDLWSDVLRGPEQREKWRQSTELEAI